MGCNKSKQSLLLSALTAVAVLAGCTGTDKSSPNTPPPSSRLSQVVWACGGGSDTTRSAKLVAELNKELAKGSLELTAAHKAGVIIYETFEKKPEIYTQYVQCIDRGITDLLKSDQRPRVAIIGSREDYTDYNLPELEATSADLLDRDLRLSFQTKPIIVTYGGDYEDAIRQFDPAVVVIHASAFYDDQLKNESVNKFQALISSLYGMQNTKFLVFSRLPPDDPASDLCKRWDRQLTYLTKVQFRDRVFFYPLTRSDTDFKGSAGIEMRQIIRCQSGTEADSFCRDYMASRKKEAQERIRTSTCQRS